MIKYRPDDQPVHYHVSIFQVGCLSDSDDGPFETAEDAISFAGDLIADWNGSFAYLNDDGDVEAEGVEIWKETGLFDGQIKRWQRGTYVIAVEQCDLDISQCGELIG